jgi:large subunit ribosomal protein L18
MKLIDKKRRIENKTNYLKRRRLLESKNPRIVIRKTNKYIIFQYVETKIAQDNVKFMLTSKALLGYGWPKEKEGSLKSLGASYLAGMAFGKLIKNEKPAIIDTGLIRNTKGSKIHAGIKGMIDSGVKVSFNEKMFPEEKRICSENIKEFFDKVKTKIVQGKAN